MNVDVILFAGLWAAFLWFPDFRTLRTILLLAAVTAILAIAWTWPTAPRIAISAGTAIALLAIHFRFNGWIIAHTPAERDFDDALTAASDRLTLAHDRFLASGDSVALREAVLRAIQEVTALHPPSTEWAEVRSLAHRLLEELLDVHDARGGDSKTRMRFRSHRAELHQRLHHARTTTRRFFR